MQTFILQQGYRKDCKLWGSLAVEPGFFIDSEQHPGTTIIEEFAADNWRAAREYVADKHFI